MNHHDVILSMRNPLVLYHGNCFDGFGSAWAAYAMFGGGAEYVPAMYGGAPPPDVTDRDVLIVDFSYPRNQLLDMNEHARSLVVLDHHKSAQADLAGLDFALFDMDRSGAGLTWDVVHQSKRQLLIEYVEDRDLWTFKRFMSKQVNAWIGCIEFTFDDWDGLSNQLETDLMSAVNMGSAILQKTDRYVRDMAKEARVVTFAGHDNIPTVNAPYINTSELVGHLAQSALFAVGWYRDGAGLYRYSLRSRGDFDVSELAKTFGGGGHKNAAGFSSETLVIP